MLIWLASALNMDLTRTLAPISTQPKALQQEEQEQSYMALKLHYAATWSLRPCNLLHPAKRQNQRHLFGPIPNETTRNQMFCWSTTWSVFAGLHFTGKEKTDVGGPLRQTDVFCSEQCTSLGPRQRCVRWPGSPLREPSSCVRSGLQS